MRKLKELISIREVASPVSTTIRTLANTNTKTIKDVSFGSKKGSPKL